MANVKITDLTAASAAAKSMLFEVTQDPAGTPASRKLSLTQLFDLDDGTKTSSAPILNLAQTWNSGVTTFTAMKINVTDTASAASSLLLDLQVGGSSVFTFTKESRIDCLYAVFGGFMYSPAIRVSSDTGELTFGSSIDLYLRRDAANTLAQRNGTSANTFRIYNTYTDGSNYERGVFDWGTTSNVLTIGTQKAGTGSTRTISVVVGGVEALNIDAVGTASFAASIYSGGDVRVHQNGLLYWNTKSVVSSPSDGILKLTNYAGTSFDRLQLGGTTSSFPAIKRVSAGLKFVLADDSAACDIEAANLNLTAGSLSGTGSIYIAPYGTSVLFIDPTLGVKALSDLLIEETYFFGWNNGGSGQSNLRLYFDAANTLAQRNGTSAQGFRVYGTYTDASNYERGGVYYQSGGSFVIASEAAGTGTYRPLSFSTSGVIPWQISVAGHFITGTDNTYDIGASGATRPRTIYVGTSINVGSYVQLANSGSFFWTGRSQITSPSDGVVSLTDIAGTSFDRLQFGGTTSSFPAIKRVSAGLKFVLADDSASAAVEALSYTSGAPNTGTAAAWKFGSLVTAAVTPDTTRYIELDVAGTLYKVIVST